jgi:uncharacterized protein (DUF302 family)
LIYLTILKTKKEIAIHCLIPLKLQNNLSSKIKKIKKSKVSFGSKVFRRMDHDNALLTKNIHIDEKPSIKPVAIISLNPNSLYIENFCNESKP